MKYCVLLGRFLEIVEIGDRVAFKTTGVVLNAILSPIF
jgi:hypothetical protein